MSNVFALLIFLYDENHSIVACFARKGVLDCMRGATGCFRRGRSQCLSFEARLLPTYITLRFEWDTYSFCAISKRNAPIRVTVMLIRVCSSIYVAVDIRYERG